MYILSHMFRRTTKIIINLIQIKFKTKTKRLTKIVSGVNSNPFKHSIRVFCCKPNKVLDDAGSEHVNTNRTSIKSLK